MHFAMQVDGEGVGVVLTHATSASPMPSAVYLVGVHGGWLLWLHQRLLLLHQLLSLCRQMGFTQEALSPVVPKKCKPQPKHKR